jgi:hypothetical protein
MSASARILVLGVLLAVPATGLANGLSFRSSQSYYHAYPSVSYRIICVEPTYAVPPECPPLRQEAAPAPRKYAQPAPAGPSSAKPITPKTTEPPRAPAVTESRSYFSAYAVAPRATERPAAERCQIGFWNLSDRDITLTVDAKKYPLPRGESIKMELGREFVWQVDGRVAHAEKLPAKEAALEIVIRR